MYSTLSSDDEIRKGYGMKPGGQCSVIATTKHVPAKTTERWRVECRFARKPP